MYDSMTHHPLFKQIAPYIKIEKYARDGGHKNPRRRIELRSDIPVQLVKKALGLEVKCCACSNPIHPFRPRLRGQGDRPEIPRHIYVAVACDLATSVGCSRGLSAKNEYLQIEKTVAELSG